MTAETTERPTVGHYEMHLTCPHCGAAMRPVTEGRPVESGRTISAIARCSGDCRTQTATWQIMVRLLPLHDQEAHH